MLEDHICFHVNQARFMVSAENCMKVSFLTYDVVHSCEHDREHVTAFLNPYNRMGNYIYHQAHCVFAVGYRPDNVDQFTKFIGSVTTMDCSATTAHHHPLGFQTYNKSKIIHYINTI
jgi:ABC-type thiamine transport system substrate-binding protein